MIRVEEIEENEGLVGETDEERILVYNESGHFHVFENVCTHLRCGLLWNQDERAWDCPCHGSRFSSLGEVLRGPARKPLIRLDYEIVGGRLELKR